MGELYATSCQSDFISSHPISVQSHLNPISTIAKVSEPTVNPVFSLLFFFLGRRGGGWVGGCFSSLFLGQFPISTICPFPLMPPNPARALNCSESPSPLLPPPRDFLSSHPLLNPSPAPFPPPSPASRLSLPNADLNGDSLLAHAPKVRGPDQALHI